MGMVAEVLVSCVCTCRFVALLVLLSWIACCRFIGGPSSRRRPLLVTVPKFASSTDELSGTPPKAIVKCKDRDARNGVLGE